MIKSYRELDVWREAMDLVAAIYSASGSFPVNERYGLTSQLRRAAVSIPSNIAEGHARFGTREFIRFIGIAMGSLAEMETQLFIAHRLCFIDDAKLNVILQTSDRVGRMLRGLAKSLDVRLSPAPSP